MLRVEFLFRHNPPLIERWPDDTTREDLYRRAEALGCVCYTPIIADDPCPRCGGEYGEHDGPCAMMRAYGEYTP